MRQLGAGPLGALVLGGLAVALLLLARLQAAPQAGNLVFALVTLLAAGLLGYLLGINGASLFHPPTRDVAIAVAAALAAVAVVMVWQRLETTFSAREWQWLAQLAGGLEVLPALLPAALVRRGGAATLGLVVSALAAVLMVSGVIYSPIQLLLVPVVALPVELFLQLRRQDAGLGTLASAGALVAAMGTLASVATQPEMLLPEGWVRLVGSVLGTAVGGALVGAVVADLARRLRPRLGVGLAVPGDSWT
jgi:hypothetical protein